MAIGEHFTLTMGHHLTIKPLQITTSNFGQQISASLNIHGYVIHFSPDDSAIYKEAG
jgi:hypothetical protein